MYFAVDSVTCTLDHPFFVNNKWVEAKELKVGNYLLSSVNGDVRIDSVYRFNTVTSTLVYNLETGQNHNYYVTASGILVHNCDKGTNVVTKTDRIQILKS